MNVSSSANSLPGGRVQAQRPDLQDGGALRQAPAGERPQPREQLGEGERLGQVVVGAAVQAGDPVVDAVARGQHEDRRPHAGLPQLPADVEAVAAGQHHVQQDGVVRGRAGHPEGVLAAARDVGGVALLDQAAADERRHLQLVFDDQRSHGFIVGALDERAMRTS
jgi:hypothetical protein